MTDPVDATVEDTTMAVMEFANGASGEWSSTSSGPGRGFNNHALFGADGSLTWGVGIHTRDGETPMADLIALGKPLAEEHVHRPELVADLTEAAVGEPVTVEMVATVLSHPQGGLKGLPKQARVIPILNQMAEYRPLREARQIARFILRNERVERVIIASLRASQPVLEVMTNDQ